MTRRSAMRSVTLAMLTCLAPAGTRAEVPVRISVKFILDANGSRPATGSVNQDSDVQDQVDRGNQILAGLGSELRVELLEIVDVAGASQFYGSTIDATTRDDIREAALDDPNGYAWRSDAVNFYVNGDGGSAISDFPSNNNIVLSGQGINATTFIHELGHSLSLYHTHETNGGGDGDACNDTITDMSSWSRDAVATNNFDDVYADLDASQQAQVDAVWDNVMSYHDGNNRSFLTLCQMNRESRTAWDDRSWMLTRQPFYVDSSAAAGGNSGSWSNPFASVDEAIASGSLENRALVLLSGPPHAMSRTLDARNVEVVARRGAATIRRDVAIWDDPADPSRSKVPAVAEAMRAVQAADRAGDAGRALAALREGQRHASGRELIAIRLELAQRLRQAGQQDAAIHEYEQIEKEADDEKLRGYALHWIGRVKQAQRAHEQAGRGHP